MCQASESQVDIWMGADSFILAGSSIVFTIDMGCTNPSSLWYSESSLRIKTFNSLQQQIEERQDFLYLSSLSPSPISQISIQYGSQIFGLESQTMAININTIHAVPRDGKIEILIPRRF
jgi:hypothetical protein